MSSRPAVIHSGTNVPRGEVVSRVFFDDARNIGGIDDCRALLPQHTDRFRHDLHLNFGQAAADGNRTSRENYRIVEICAWNPRFERLAIRWRSGNACSPG